MLSDYFYVQLRSSVRVVLPLECTKEVMVITRGEICPIPGVASALLGVVNQRGRLLWVLELSDLLKLPSGRKKFQPQDSLTSVLITNQQTSESGATSLSWVNTPTLQLTCVVAVLQGVVSMNSASFKPLPAKLSPSVKNFFTGVAEINHSPVAVLNVNAIFAALQAAKIADNAILF